MKKIMIVVFALAVLSTPCFAKDEKVCVLEKKPTATTPVGAVLETAGVFVGKIASTCEIAATGERKITVENETGECRIFPFCAATKVADKSFNAVTFDKLKAGEPVKVEYAKEGDVEKAQSVTLEK